MKIKKGKMFVTVYDQHGKFKKCFYRDKCDCIFVAQHRRIYMRDQWFNVKDIYQTDSTNNNVII